MKQLSPEVLVYTVMLDVEIFFKTTTPTTYVCKVSIFDLKAVSKTTLNMTNMTFCI